VDELTYYNATIGRYSVQINDVTRNSYDFIWGPKGEMAPPKYGEFEAEQPYFCTPNGGWCGNPPVPDFSMFTTSIAEPLFHTYDCGLNCLLGLFHNGSMYRVIGGTSITDTAPIRGVVIPPPAPGESSPNCLAYTCFNASYDSV
jgi:hypothetical protein